MMKKYLLAVLVYLYGAVPHVAFTVQNFAGLAGSAGRFCGCCPDYCRPVRL